MTQEFETSRAKNALLRIKESLRVDSKVALFNEESFLEAMEELLSVVSENSGNPSDALEKVFQTALHTIFCSTSSVKVKQILKSQKESLVLATFLCQGPPNIALEVLLQSLKERRVQSSVILGFMKRLSSRSSIIKVLCSQFSSKDKANHAISLLVSLPERISNHIEKDEANFDTKEYLENLFAAIYSCANKPVGDVDVTHTSAIGVSVNFPDLLSRLCATGRSKEFLLYCCSFQWDGNENAWRQLSQWFATISPRYIEKFLAELLESVDSCQGNLSFVEYCLREVAKENMNARKCLMFILPRKKIFSILAVSLLIRTIVDIVPQQEKQVLLEDLLSFWSSVRFIFSHPVNYQFQNSRILLHLLKHTSKDLLSVSAIQLIANGVQHRLGHTDGDVRYMGIVIGKYFARCLGVCSKPDWEFSEKIRPTEDLEEPLVSDILCTPMKGNVNETETSSRINSYKSRTGNMSISVDSQTVSGIDMNCLDINDSKSEESFESLEPYPVSDSESSQNSEDADVSVCTDKKQPVPNTVHGVLSLFKQFHNTENEESWDLSLFIKTLKNLEGMLRERARTISNSVADLTLAVFHLDSSKLEETKDTKILEDLRREVLLRLADCSPREFFLSLLCNVYQSDSVCLKDKSGALAFVTQAAYLLSGLGKDSGNMSKDATARISMSSCENVEQKIVSNEKGTVLKFLKLSMQHDKRANMRSARNRFAPVALEAFFAVWTGITTELNKRQRFGDMHEILLEQTLSVLSVFILCCGRANPSFEEMLRAHVEIAFMYYHSPNPAVRRAATMALGATMEIINAREWRELERNYRARFYRSLVNDWLEGSSGDPDEACRQMQIRCLEKWAEKVPEGKNIQCISMWQEKIT